MSKRAYGALATLLSAACRFVGPQDSPTELIEVETGVPEAGRKVDASAEEEGSEPRTDARVPDRGTVDARVAPIDAASADAATADSGTADSGTADSGTADSATMPRNAASARPDASAASCDPPPDLACDPVSGEGCLPLMQCLVVPGSSDPAAYCVLSGIQLDVTCTQGGLSTDCPPQHTCVMGQCRKYCYCDADCDSGAACKDPSGEGSIRFKLCEQTSLS
jgi:hypothetical protein